MHVPVTLFARLLDCNGNGPELPVPDAALGHDRLREVDYRLGRPFEDHGLEAILVIQMGMHGRYRQIVVIMLHPRQSAGELPLVMVVDIAEGAYTVLRGARIHLRAAERSTYEVAEGLRPTSIALLLDQPIECVCQVIVH